MAIYNQSQAAKKAGVTRQTIYRYIKKGKLSATKDEDGNTCIDEAELGRVFNINPVDDSETGNDTVTSAKSHQRTPQSDNLELLNYQVEQLQAQLEEEKARNKQLMDIVENQTLALPSPSKSESKGFIARLLGK